MPEFVFIAGASWLDFVNTVVRVRGRVVDLLPDPDRLAAWLAARAARSGDVQRSAEAAGEDTYRSALQLRRLLRRLAEDGAAERDDVETSLAGLNAFLNGMPVRFQLEQIGPVVREHVQVDGAAATLYPVVRSALDYLSGTDRVRRCENPNCVLYFLETPRSRRRRWCSMSGCGNRMKAARHYRRRWGGSGGSAGMHSTRAEGAHG